MKTEFNQTEINLIREWKHNKNEDIALYFFNKYKEDVLNIVFEKINRKFSSIPLEKGDFFHVVWKSVLTCLHKYKLTKKNNFRNLLILDSYCGSLREALKFVKNTHIVLNNSYSYEGVLSKNGNFNFGKHNIVSNVGTYEQARQKLITNILEFNKVYDIKFIKNIIYLRSLGHSCSEISKKLRKPRDMVNKAINYVIEIAKNIYY